MSNVETGTNGADFDSDSDLDEQGSAV